MSIKSPRITIETQTILDHLMAHISGEKKMDSTQIRAAEILLKKTLPDLKSCESEIDPSQAAQTLHIKREIIA